MTTDLTKRYQVEEGLIKELTGFKHWSGRFYNEWVWSTYKIHDSFDTYKEAEALLEKLKKRSTGYTHYKITKKLFSNLIL